MDAYGFEIEDEDDDIVDVNTCRRNINTFLKCYLYIYNLRFSECLLIPL